jgi:DNA-binding LacI/PurR family transcriptional regulator
MPRKRSTNTKNITITSIAKELGVSVATVSYVMNGKTQENGISEKTAERVRQVAKELGYVPNYLARSLRLQRTQGIGVILSDLQQGWAHRTLKGMLSVLDPEEYVPYISVHFWDPERERREIESMVKRRLEAIITVPMPENIEEYKLLIDTGIPLIFLQDEMEDLPEVSFAMWDAREAARACVAHFIANGRSRIAFVGVDHFTPWMKMRFEGYKQALAEAGLEFREEWAILEHRQALSTSPTKDGDFGGAIRELLDSDHELPDAMLAMNDAVAMTTLSVLEGEYGYRIPDEIAVMGMGNLAQAPLVGLSSAHEPIEEVGIAAAQAALELSRSKKPKAIRCLVPGAQLHIRRSSAPRSTSGPIPHRSRRSLIHA